MREGILAPATLCAAVFVLAALAGCRKAIPPVPDAVRSHAGRGPLKFSIEARPVQAWLGDPIEVTLSVHTPDDYLVQFPVPADFGKLEARATDTPDPSPAPQGGLNWRRTFVVDSFSSGTLEIPPLVVTYARKPAEPGATPDFDNELVTDTLKVEVRSALTTQDSPMQPRDITGTLLPARPRRLWPWLVAAGAVVGAVAGAFFLVRYIQRRRLRGPPPIAAEIWALRMLAKLQPDEVESGRAREFYYQLSETVRAYIEKKFALAAPEMTTEEFLVTLLRDRSLLPYDADRLRPFLEACDIVKYAAYSPRRPDAEQALETARAFVHQTAAAAQHRLEAGATGAGASGSGVSAAGGQAA